MKLSKSTTVANFQNFLKNTKADKMLFLYIKRDSEICNYRKGKQYWD